MAAAASTQHWEHASRRRRLRYRVHAPLDVTVLRSGVPDILPGRSVNVGEGGVAAIFAGELLPGEPVGVEIQLPHAAAPLRVRALVRHHDKLCSGMEFVGMSPEERSIIRAWAQETNAEPTLQARSPVHPANGGKRGGSDAARQFMRNDRGRRRTFLLLLLVLAAGITLFAFCWYWNRGWEDLESGLPNNQKTVVQPEAYAPAAVMEKLVTHRVDPDYPAEARPGKLQGVILLDVVISRQGTVVRTRALNGPDVLARAAESALRWWRFEPYLVNDRPTAVETTVAVEFKP
jgi:TonB family protein